MPARAKSQETSASPRRRLSPAERQLFILEGAIAYFAEFGFDRATRDLAAHLGISQSLIYRYFPSKSSLIDRIYDVVFINRWNDSWEGTLADRTRALAERLKDFYRDYDYSINRNEVIRISLYSALHGLRQRPENGNCQQNDRQAVDQRSHQQPDQDHDKRQADDAEAETAKHVLDYVDDPAQGQKL